ncbi:helix-turn-helix domain-containing protein [Phytomonospora endophytica]|uniref:Transcriptional regulator with XRE-family HTH domain n=1 Tax=Phytomonospora endophytica TaxID=714109 RepID=A0A841FPC6_9ACTN|nr:helix-turn-helix domain-containing protein [Phytomonospora endophytica]MBB6037684.1 transcriptional regulator with XRE-family HTH domain [Phytomonospora endophytica]GIG67789.1 hypothetical protein Pen01_40840 [Phytomonospora endophytica]
MTAGHHPEARLANRFRHLLTTVTSITGRAVSTQQIADGINHAAGRTLISRSYLDMIRAGRRTGIGHDRLAAIATFFNVPIEYFTSDDVPDDPFADTQARTAITDRLIRDIAITADGLPDEDLHAILRLAKAARQLRGLDDPQAPVPRVPEPPQDTAPEPTDSFHWHAAPPPLRNPFSTRTASTADHEE